MSPTRRIVAPCLTVRRKDPFFEPNRLRDSNPPPYRLSGMKRQLSGDRAVGKRHQNKVEPCLQLSERHGRIRITYRFAYTELRITSR